MKSRYWITAICIVLTLVGHTICYAVTRAPIDGKKFSSEADFPIPFKWEAQPEQVCLKVWSVAQGGPESGNPVFRGELIEDTPDIEMKTVLDNGKYQWAVYDRVEQKLLELRVFIVDIQEEILPPWLDFDEENNHLSIQWRLSEPSSRIDSYEVILTGSSSEKDPPKHVQSPTRQSMQEFNLKVNRPQEPEMYRVQIIAYDSKHKELAKSEVKQVKIPGIEPKGGDPGTESKGGDPGTESKGGDPGTEPEGGDPGTEPEGGDPNTPTKKRTSWDLLGVLSLWILIISGIIIALLAIRYGFFWLKEKLRQDTDDGSYYWGQHKRKELLTTSSNDIENQMIMKLARSMRRIQEEFQDMQRMVKTSTARNKVDLRLLTDEIREVRERIKGGTEDYVSASQFKSETETLETLLSESTEQLRKDLYREMGQLNEKIASLENDLITLRKERLAEKNAAVVAARKELDILIEQVAAALPQDAANLLNALSIASHADELPHLGDVGQRLLSEICSSKGGASLRSYIETMDKLQEICEKLDHLLTRTLPDAEQRSSRLLGEAQEILTAYTKTKGSKSFDSELIERTRRALLKEIGMLYISIVMGRFRGDGAKAYSQLAETLKQLGLDLINITIGQTRPDERLHDVQSAMPTDKYPSGTIANVVKMGYIESATGEISKAQVIVSQ